MYPTRELRRLAAHKEALRHDIALRRAECAAAAAHLSRPLQWADRVVAFWRKISPVAKLFGVPLGAMALRTLFRRLGPVGSLARWAPLILSVVRGFKTGAAAARPE
ncbi:MAG: hypothetical protein JWM88_2816 [Verrucomicrobia bacterium]|nr:hypothetical protein [Verrucomicrobiota bacterium]